MPLKIFISYRRQDTGASAVGIGQYLENEFGRKNVYIDVDMQAGAKYPAVIEKHLAECRVLLVLIGPEWVKLQKPNDWVQREITYALKREITVIPVLINGTQLPDQELLPDDIKGLLDHQAATVSLAGFRHEMAGLVKDIRSIGNRKPWRLLGAIAAALILSVSAGIFVHAFGFYNLLKRVQLRGPSTESLANGTWTNGFWKSNPSEWVLYAIDNAQPPAAYFLKPSSIKSFGDSVAYVPRFVLHSNATSQSTFQGTYEDNLQVLDCKKSVFVIAERTVYSLAGETIFHFKAGEPESFDLSSSGQPVNPGSVMMAGEHILCDEQLRSLLVPKPRFLNEHLSYFANSPDGDGSFFYGSKWPSRDPAYSVEILTLIKRNNDHTFAELFPGQNVRGLPADFRTIAGNAQIKCGEKKVFTPADEYYDKDDHLVYLAAQGRTVMEVKSLTPFDVLLSIACGQSAFNVAGHYYGMNYISYQNKAQVEQKVSVTIQQNGSDLKVSFETPNGATGEGTGKLAGNRAESISLHSTTLGCPGSYDGSMSFADNSVGWSYKGEDCGGPMEGHGTAPKVTQ
jgi:TIR domain